MFSILQPLIYYANTKKLQGDFSVNIQDNRQLTKNEEEHPFPFYQLFQLCSHLSAGKM